MRITLCYAGGLCEDQRCVWGSEGIRGEGGGGLLRTVAGWTGGGGGLAKYSSWMNRGWAGGGSHGS